MTDVKHTDLSGRRVLRSFSKGGSFSDAVGVHNLAQEPLGFKCGFGPKGHGISAQESVGFKCGFGPKGHGNLAQALAWVALFLPASPVRASDNAG
jgi:hypothetical protein